jgi:hypothetical protein
MDVSKGWVLAIEVKPATACREANYSWDIVKSEMTAAAGTIGTAWMSSAVGPPELTVEKSATIEKTAAFNRNTSK